MRLGLGEGESLSTMWVTIYAAWIGSKKDGGGKRHKTPETKLLKRENHLKRDNTLKDDPQATCFKQLQMT